MGYLAGLRDEHPAEFLAATKHAFLTDCGKGTLPPVALKTWIAQDYLFAFPFVRLVASALAAAPDRYQDLLTGGLGDIVPEKKWFLSQHEALGIDEPSKTVALPQCSAFMAWLEARATGPYLDRILAVFFVELSYGLAWAGALPLAPPFDVTSQIWVSERFKNYLAGLEAAAEEAVEAAGEEGRARARELFLDVCRLEKAFWNMTYEQIQG